MTDNKYNTEETPRVQTKKTGAKKALIAISLVGVLVAGGIGLHYANEWHKDYKETQRAESLVVAYTKKELEFCSLPDEVIVNKAYDASFCDGEKLVEALNSNAIKYCEIDDTYYTPNGDDIAILTFRITNIESQAANKYEYDGNIVYMPPVGYDLNGAESQKETTSEITVYVPKSQNGDYSGVSISNCSKSELIDCKEISTKPYSTITEQTLICDVDDNAKLNENNQCEAQLRLIQKKH